MAEKVEPCRRAGKLLDYGKRIALLVYEMSYAAAGEMAMVLPLPVASRDEDDAVRFMDLSACPGFFDELARLVWLWGETPTIA